MGNVNTVCSEEVANLYDELNRKYRYMINMKDEYVDNLRYVACEIRKLFSKTGYSDEIIADMLVEYLYGHEKRYKQLLWFCYGQCVVNSLEKNIQIKKTKFVQCIDCGEWVEVDIDSKLIRCDKCKDVHRKRQKIETWNKNKNKYRPC